MWVEKLTHLLVQFWQAGAAVIGASIYIWFASAGRPKIVRAGIVASSTALGVSLGGELAAEFGAPFNVTVVAVSTLSWAVLDLLRAVIGVLLSDPQALLNEILRRIPGGRGK